MKRNESGFSRGFGFVKFATAEAAQVAVSANTGILVRDKVVDVKPHGTPPALAQVSAYADGGSVRSLVERFDIEPFPDFSAK